MCCGCGSVLIQRARLVRNATRLCGAGMASLCSSRLLEQSLAQARLQNSRGCLRSSLVRHQGRHVESTIQDEIAALGPVGFGHSVGVAGD